jgi:drug/metabolite transporter (DMT)-like permease
LASRANTPEANISAALSLLLVSLSSTLLRKKHKGGDDDTESSWIGIIAILISLFCDGLLGSTQGEIKKKFNPNQWDQMESLNKWAGMICLTVANVSFQMGGFIKFVMDHPAVIKDLVLLAVLGTVGQIFIFYTIANFSPLILSIVTTTRKFFTVLASIVIYHHQMSVFQWLSIGLVFTGVFVEMLSGSKKHGKEEHKKIPQGDDVEAKVLVGVDETATKRNLKD